MTDVGRGKTHINPKAVRRRANAPFRRLALAKLTCGGTKKMVDDSRRHGVQDPYRKLVARHHLRSHGVPRLARRYVPFWWRRVLLTPYLLARDGVDFLLGRSQELVPPRYLDFAGNLRYIEAGQQHLKYFRELCGLQPHHRVLDIGCGIGRMAVAL